MRDNKSHINISFTANIVLLCLVALYNNSMWNRLVEEKNIKFYNACISYFRKQSRLLNLLCKFKRIDKLVDILLCFGAPQHFALRKSKILQKTSEYITQNSECQLVVIGSGFDLLAYNIGTQYSNTKCFEIDKPAMSNIKQDILKKAYNTLPNNLFFIAADLSEVSIFDALSNTDKFAPNLPTIFVMEGVSMYLSQDSFMNVFKNIKQLTKKEAIFIFTAIPNKKDTQNKFVEFIRKLFLSKNNESFSFSIDSSKMPDFLMENGFSNREIIAYSDLQKPYRTANELARLEQQNGEYIVCCAPL